jgi:hypothetical protein
VLPTMAMAAFAEGLGRLFYLNDPRTTSFDRVEDVPDYISQAIPFFVGTILVEAAVGALVPGHRRTRVNDGATSVAAGMVMQIMHKFFLATIEVSTFIWCYNRFHVVELDVHNALTWVLGFLAVDCGYYWFHRYGHEINLFWAAHIVRTPDPHTRLSVRVAACDAMAHGWRGLGRCTTALRTTTKRRRCGRACCRRTRPSSSTCRLRCSCRHPCLWPTSTLMYASQSVGLGTCTMLICVQRCWRDRRSISIGYIPSWWASSARSSGS